MGKFVDENLAKGEAIRYTGKVSLWKYIFSFIFGGLLAIVSIPPLIVSIFSKEVGVTLWAVLTVCAVLLLVVPFVARRSTELVITDKRFIAKYGLVSTHSIEIRFAKIETVRVNQSLLGKMLNYGDIVVTGTGSTFDPIRGVANAMKFRMALNQAMDSPDTLAKNSPPPVV